MKKYCLIFLYLLLSISVKAALVDVKTNLWSGIQELDAGWSNWVSVAAGNFTNAEAGNTISVTISKTSSSSALIMLNTGTWKTLPGAEAGKTIGETPCEMKWKITADMLKELKANGLIVKGISYTVTSIDLIHQVKTSDAEKGNPVKSLWTGKKMIDWSGAVSNGWQALDHTLFDDVKVGNKLRFNVSELSIGAMAHLNTGDWKDMPDGKEYKQLASTYFEYAVTSDMLAQLQAKGCVVSGIGFVLNSVEIIDPTQIPTLICKINKSHRERLKMLQFN